VSEAGKPLGTLFASLRNSFFELHRARLTKRLENLKAKSIQIGFQGRGPLSPGAVCSANGSAGSSVNSSVNPSMPSGQGEFRLPPICVNYDSTSLESGVNQYTLLFVISLFALILLYYFIFKSISKTIFAPIENLLFSFKSLSVGKPVSVSFNSKNRSLLALEAYANSTFNQIKDYRVKENEAIKNEALGVMAAQVSHDIRSPLSALEMILSTLKELPEEKRIIIRNSVNRIRDIANSLLSQYRQNRQSPQHEQSLPAPLQKSVTTLLSPLIESVVTEMRLQYRDQLGIEIEFNHSDENYGLFSSIQPIEFKRMISNLINNSVESLIDGAGKIDVSLSSAGDQIIIGIQDNGIGIPSELISKLGERGFSVGKKSGSGLGLHHAFATVKNWGGRLNLAPHPTRGTIVTLTLKMETPPAWFVPKLSLKAGTTVVACDDDQSVHQIWQKRLKGDHSKKLNLMHFSSPPEFKSYYSKEFGDLDQAVFLMDYELIGHRETGLDLVEQLGIQHQTILVTSHYEESDIRDRCLRLGVKMIPKPLSGFVPVDIHAHESENQAAIGLS
jgi:signal transduction histidine kinase